MKEGLYMSTLTKNYGLEKPAQTDFYDVNVFNSNTDIIDEELKKAAKGEGLEFSVVDGILNATHEGGGTAQIADKPTLDEILALLENTTYGLNALKNIINSKNVDLTPVTNGLTTVQNTLNNTTYGLNAIKTAINGRANESTVVATKSLLENGTYGLSALNNDLDIIQNTLNNGTYGLNAIKNAASGGCVKSVQRGIVKEQTPPSGVIEGALHTNVANVAPYIDVPIAGVNMNKSIVLLQVINYSNSYSYVGELTSSTNLRVFYRAAGGAGSALIGGFGWQVIEFY